MTPVQIEALSPQQLDWILAARPGAVRTALRLAGRNRVGLKRDDILALAEDGLLHAARVFDPARESKFEACANAWVRGKVLHALRSRRRIQKHEVPAGTQREVARAEARALLDELGEGLDPDNYDEYDDTDADFLREALRIAGEGAAAVVLGWAARGAGGVERSLMKRELLERLDAEVAKLSPAQVRLKRMRFDDGMTLDQIAVATRIPRSTVHVQLQEIVAILRERLAE